MIRFLLGLILIATFATLLSNAQQNSLKKAFKIEKATTESLKGLLSSEDRVILDGPFKIHSFKTAPVTGVTRVYINQSKDPVLSLTGFYYTSEVVDLDIKNKIEAFVIQLNTGGKLLNSLVYRHQDGSLTRIPVSTEIPGGYLGTESSGGAEFIDIDKDGVLEMLVYSRHYPPEAKRTVTLYKFDGEMFVKNKEYTEQTPVIYL